MYVKGTQSWVQFKTWLVVGSPPNIGRMGIIQDSVEAEPTFIF